MSFYLLTDIYGRLEDAKGCLKEACWEMEYRAEDQGRTLEHFLRADEELKELYDRIQTLKAEIDTLWTGALKARLQEERDEQGRQEELADVSSY